LYHGIRATFYFSLERNKHMKIFLSLLLLILISGCTSPLQQVISKSAAEQLANMTADQILAWAKAGTVVRACLQVNGPPPAGSGTIMFVPASDTQPVNFGNDCHPIPPPIPPVILQQPPVATKPAVMTP
jgi:uncharacterized protein YceK